MSGGKKHSAVLMALCIWFSLFLVSACASSSPKTEKEQSLAQEYEAEKKAFIAQYMNLTEGEAEKFWPIYEGFQKEIDELNGRYIILIYDYILNHPNISNELAREMLDECISIEESLLDTRRRYLPKFHAVLPESKVFRYYQLENKIEIVKRYEASKKIPMVE